LDNIKQQINLNLRKQSFISFQKIQAFLSKHRVSLSVKGKIDMKLTSFGEAVALPYQKH